MSTQAQTAPSATDPTSPEAADSIQGFLRRALDNIRTGNVGSLPVILGLAFIVLFFSLKNSNYYGPTNFNNIIVQMAGVTCIAYGVVFVLLLGEIDLSIGFASGVCGVVAAQMAVPGSSHDFPGLIAIFFALLTGITFGLVQGSFVAFLGIPSFVVTLAGYLAAQGIILRAVGEGVIVIQNNTINNVANYFLPHWWKGWVPGGWSIAIAVAVLYALAQLLHIVSRARARVPVGNIPLTLVKVLLVAGVALFIAFWSNRDPNRGVPFALILIVGLLAFWTFIAKRTVFGRHVYAVGGSAEAARRAGINVTRIRLIVFGISGLMSAVGGVVLAARLRSVDLGAGGGTLLIDAISAAVIGGTSLFGGRGEVKSALFGSLIIATIANGIDLVGYSSSTRYILTAAILLAAITIDTLTRRRQEQSGR
ncbi:MAG: sugar ABC transporter permease [Gaiellaceae bacterium]